jgi:hypothetical protein
MGADCVSEGQAQESEALAASWPRSLIADGRAAALALWWVQSRDRSEALGLPRIARHGLDRSVADGLFEARRSRRLERGLEGAETLLAAEAAGLAKVPQAQSRPDQVRISRLLIVSGDGSVRFYREVEKLRARFAKRLEVLLLDCDEDALGAAAFGAGRRSRALLIHHKDAVVRFLSSLDIG